MQVKRTMFHQIFLQKFNIGFSSPASDTCCTCTLLLNNLKKETNAIEKERFFTQKRLHTLRAKAFYTHLKTNVPKSKTLCFDMQKVLNLPKTPIQEAFYSRQLNLYNFCIVNTDSTNPDFYCWNETQSGRGAEVIGSALLHHLNNIEFADDTELLRLFCDGCGGQNKNCHIIHTLAFWLLNKSPKSMKEIHIFFPVRGHSFLPADRVFGRLEKELRKISVITTEEEYFQIFEKHGRVHKLYDDWTLYDIKALGKRNYKKIDGIQSLKRIQLRKSQSRNSDVQIKCNENFFYESTQKFQPLLKRGQNHPRTIKEKYLKRVLSNEKKEMFLIY